MKNSRGATIFPSGFQLRFPIPLALLRLRGSRHPAIIHTCRTEMASTFGHFGLRARQKVVKRRWGMANAGQFVGRVQAQELDARAILANGANVRADCLPTE